MADESKVLGIRLDPEERKRFDDFVAEEGKNNKTFLDTLLNLYELNKGKVKNINLVGDIETLESYTNKIQQAFVNVIDKLESQKGDITEHSQRDLQIYKDKVNNLEIELEALKLVNTTKNKELTDVNKDLLTLEGETKALNESLKDKLTIIEEYKGKNDTLTGIFEEYKGYKVENETVKGLLAAQQADNIELKNSLKGNDYIIGTLNKDLEKMQKDHEKELNNVKQELKDMIDKLQESHAQELQVSKDKLIFEKDRALLELQKAQQDQRDQDQQKHNEAIEIYQAKYKTLLEELEHGKAPQKKTTAKEKSI